MLRKAFLVIYVCTIILVGLQAMYFIGGTVMGALMVVTVLSAFVLFAHPERQ